MQRLLQLVPSAALRLPQACSVLNGLSLPAVRQSLRTQTSIPATCSSLRFISYSYLNSNTPERPSNPQHTPEDRWRVLSKEARERPDPDLTPKNPYSGRSCTNSSSRTLANTFKKLDSILLRNYVRKELRMTERHEKKGEKRRRLKSQRWKNRFSNEVRLKVQLVNKIRMRGA